MVLDKDAEIEAFIPEDYWNLSCEVTPGAKKDSFTVKYYGTYEGGEIVKPEGGKVTDKTAADRIYENVKDSDLEAFSVKKGKGSRKPAPPFTTSTALLPGPRQELPSSFMKVSTLRGRVRRLSLLISEQTP